MFISSKEIILGIILIKCIFNKHISKELRIQIILKLYGGDENYKNKIIFFNWRIDISVIMIW